MPPKHLLRALLLQVLYSVRSERLLMDLQYHLLFRWFVGLDMDDPVWTPTTVTKKPRPDARRGIGRAFFEDIVAQARGQRLLSEEHFTVDGTDDRVGEALDRSADRAVARIDDDPAAAV